MKQAIAWIAGGLLAGLAACSATKDPSGPTCSVLGCVERSGPIAVDEDTTALEVVQRAGVVEGRSDLSRVELVRTTLDGELEMQLNLEEMLESGNSTFNVLVQPGDVLRVPEQTR
jgi:polysaccharide export outer membrane protein